MNESFGEYIRKRRIELGLTQREVAVLAGFKSLAHLSDIEGNKRHPSVEALPRLADALKVTVETLQEVDPRVPLQDAKKLLDRRPELVAAFRRVVDAAQHATPQEINSMADRLKPPPKA